MQYTTKDGERLDIICARHYGTVNNTFEQVLYDHANADLTTAEIFSAGVTITLPVITPAEKKVENQLWE
ncbi:tail protein X [Klebsiella aerogenes]|uniref:tail protein X n=1 Tax=Klebsiella aerogenes TaxID=548 RepID=UPI002E37E2C5|nr:tail protein X [Klebsiella aerogenes]MED7790465.1 tail protein X [Klebsiella aerogenes]